MNIKELYKNEIENFDTITKNAIEEIFDNPKKYVYITFEDETIVIANKLKITLGKELDLDTWTLVEKLDCKTSKMIFYINDINLINKFKNILMNKEFIINYNSVKTETDKLIKLFNNINGK